MPAKGSAAGNRGRLSHARHRRRVLFFMDYYIPRVHEGVIRYARRADWVLDSTLAYMRSAPSRWTGHGMIVEAHNPRSVDRLLRLKLPCACLFDADRRFRGIRVRQDDAAAGAMAARHLLERGFSRFIYYQIADTRVFRERYEGFRRTVAAAGHQASLLDPNESSRDRQHQTRFDWLVQRLREMRPPVGILASSDPWGVELMQACEEAGLAVPEQAAIVGIDNDPIHVELASVPMSSVDNDMHQVGFRAARALDAMLDDGSGSGGTLVIPPSHLASRQSTDILAVAEPQVAKALGFIYRHYRDLITVADVGRRVDISLRQLQTNFKRTLGRSIHDQIHRLRIEHAERLLAETTLPMETVARQSGFSSGKYFGIVFKQAVNRSPRAYRMQHGQKP